jgi:tRNA-binding protein
LATLDELLDLDVRVGTIVVAETLRGARRPSLVLTIDFGSQGRRTACIESAGRDEPEALVGLQVAAVLNLPLMVVAGTEVQVRVLSAPDSQGDRVLLLPERPLTDGSRILETLD